MSIAAIGCIAFQQQPRNTDPHRLAAIKQVMDYRRFVLNDTSQFQTCDLLRELGAGTTMPAFAPYQRTLLDQPNGCVTQSSERNSGPVAVRSIELAGDSLALVKLAISHGEYFHVETYSVKGRGDHRWVDSVVLSRGSQRELSKTARP